MAPPIEDRNSCVAEKYQAYTDVTNQEDARTFLENSKINGQAIRDCFQKQPKARHQELAREIKRANQVVAKSKFYQGLDSDDRSDLKLATRSMLTTGQMPPEPLGFWTKAAIVTSPVWILPAIGLSPLYFIFKGIAEEAEKNRKNNPPSEHPFPSQEGPTNSTTTVLATPQPTDDSWMATHLVSVRLLTSGSMDRFTGWAFGGGAALTFLKKDGPSPQGVELEYLYANNFHQGSSQQALVTYHWMYHFFDLFAGGGYVYTNSLDENAQGMIQHHAIVARLGIGARFGNCRDNESGVKYCVGLELLQGNFGVTFDGKFAAQFQPKGVFEMTF